MVSFAVLSDVHANLEALKAVAEKIGDLQTYCLGDLVDYGANPNEVVDWIRNRRIPSVLGNHDHTVVTGDVSMMNPKAAISSHWTSLRLSAQNMEFLKSLPRELRTSMSGEEFYMAHGSPDDPLWEYVDPRTHGLLFGHYLAKLGVSVIGLGHTHVPYVVHEQRGIVFNPGSVGQPRDGDRRASFALVSENSGKLEVAVNRIEYDYKTAAEKIRTAGLPGFFADRLSSGT